ncbi:MAG TPA: orotidine-5'-phosphate decarboxylase [Oculatellaceae cyanobacterium]
MTVNAAAAPKSKERLIVALDCENLEEAKRWIESLRQDVGLFKIGLELYARYGTQIFDVMKNEDVPFFFDCKFMDIPNTVAGASRGLVGRRIKMFNVHATGGSDMMKASLKAVEEEAEKQKTERPLVIAVTVLTSITRDILEEEIGIKQSVEATVGRFALLTKKAGLDGVVCAASEVSTIRKLCGDKFLTVTPGIRPTWAGDDDQRRIVTPAQAVKNGSDYIVVGRPITRAKNMVDAARRIVEEMQTVEN